MELHASTERAEHQSRTEKWKQRGKCVCGGQFQYEWYPGGFEPAGSAARDLPNLSGSC